MRVITQASSKGAAAIQRDDGTEHHVGVARGFRRDGSHHAGIARGVAAIEASPKASQQFSVMTARGHHAGVATSKQSRSVAA